MALRWILALLLVLSLTFSFSVSLFASDNDDLWKEFKIRYGKNFTSKEEFAKRQIWEKTVTMIAKHNIQADMGLHTFWLEINRFADWTLEERQQLRGFKTVKQIQRKIATFFSRPFEIPASVDWREKGYVTPIKDQGNCGSCWAFSSTGALEGQQKAKFGSLVSLSEQNLVDCSWKQGNEGCNGGWMDYALDYVIANHGIDTEVFYPYRGKKSKCRFNTSAVGASCKTYVKIQKENESELQLATATVGPISVAIDASGDKFMFYKDGVYSDSTCSPFMLDHAVLVVGYGTERNTDYWIVKNSWGEDWGKDGYILMSRNAKNQCGIASHALFPVL